MKFSNRYFQVMVSFLLLSNLFSIQAQDEKVGQTSIFFGAELNLNHQATVLLNPGFKNSPSQLTFPSFFIKTMTVSNFSEKINYVFGGLLIPENNIYSPNGNTSWTAFYQGGGLFCGLNPNLLIIENKNVQIGFFTETSIGFFNFRIVQWADNNDRSSSSFFAPGGIINGGLFFRINSISIRPGGSYLMIGNKADSWNGLNVNLSVGFDL